METQAFSQLFPLLHTANPETIDWLLEIATTEEYDRNEEILADDDWGRAVYLIASGWVKLQYIYPDKTVTQAILGKGDFFGEIAILDEFPEQMIVVALSSVDLFAISAQRFLQILSKDNKLQQRLLQLTLKRLRQFNIYWQLRHYSPAARLAKILILIAENYGESEERGTVIFKIPEADLADITDLDVDEISKIIDNLQSNGWIEIDPSNRTLCLTNLKQLIYLAGKV
jgi:CRP/FNR family cyclic AMP-dependent transcriptional regulator